MKKHLIIIGFLLLGILPAHAQTNSEFRFSSSNDSWGGGATRFYDDFRSYGFQFSYQRQDKFLVNTKFSHLTNRFAKEEKDLVSFDELIFDFSLPVFFFDEEKRNSFRPKLGFVLKSSYLGTKIQDFAHDAWQIPKLEVTADTDNSLHILIGYAVNKDLMRTGLNEELSASLFIENEFNYAHDYAYTFKVGMPFQIRSDYSKASLGVHYTLAESLLDDNVLLSNVIESESGLSLRLDVEGKLFYYHFEAFPSQKFSTGGVGIRIGNPKEGALARKRFIEVEPSFLGGGYGFNFKYSFLPSQVLQRKTNIILNHGFFRPHLNDYPEVNGHAYHLAVGAELRLLPTKDKDRVVEPYANLSVGNNTVKVYSKVRDIEAVTSNRLAINNDVGIYFTLHKSLLAKNSPLRFVLYHRFMLLPSPDPNNLQSISSGDNGVFESVQQTWGFGVNFRI